MYEISSWLRRKLTGTSTRPNALTPKKLTNRRARVLADDRHPLALADAALVERGRLRACQLADATVRERAQALLARPRCAGIGLVDDADPIGIDELGSFELIGDGQRYTHRAVLLPSLDACLGGPVGGARR